MELATSVTPEVKTGNPTDTQQGSFVVGAGLGHQGAGWLAQLLDRSELNISALHEKKLDLIDHDWLKLLKYEHNNGIDGYFLPYLQFFDDLLNELPVVVDFNSWSIISLPKLHSVFPIDKILFQVNNGINVVNSAYQHLKDESYLNWLEDRMLFDYWNLFKNSVEPWNKMSSWAKWCYWWNLNAVIPNWLQDEVGSGKVKTYRFEDIIQDTIELNRLLININPITNIFFLFY